MDNYILIWDFASTWRMSYSRAVKLQFQKHPLKHSKVLSAYIDPSVMLLIQGY